jgi:hypothetical protein
MVRNRSQRWSIVPLSAFTYLMYLCTSNSKCLKCFFSLPRFEVPAHCQLPILKSDIIHSTCVRLVFFPCRFFGFATPYSLPYLATAIIFLLFGRTQLLICRIVLSFSSSNCLSRSPHFFHFFLAAFFIVVCTTLGGFSFVCFRGYRGNIFGSIILVQHTYFLFFFFCSALARSSSRITSLTTECAVSPLPASSICNTRCFFFLFWYCTTLVLFTYFIHHVIHPPRTSSTTPSSFFSSNTLNGHSQLCQLHQFATLVVSSFSFFVLHLSGAEWALSALPASSTSNTPCIG